MTLYTLVTGIILACNVYTKHDLSRSAVVNRPYDENIIANEFAIVNHLRKHSAYITQNYYHNKIL